MRKRQKGGTNWFFILIVLVVGGFVGYKWFMNVTTKMIREQTPKNLAAHQAKVVKERKEMALRKGGVHHQGVTVYPGVVTVSNKRQKNGTDTRSKYLTILLTVRHDAITDVNAPLEKRLIQYREWSRAETTLTDDRGNRYQRKAASSMLIKESPSSDQLTPGASVRIEMVFDAPRDRDFQWLKLSLPAANVSRSGTIEVTIPASKVTW